MEKKTWLVAVSGGPDSMALLHILQEQAYSLAVAHINYKQRAVSDTEEAMIKAYCKKHHIPFHTKQYDVGLKGNFQANARHFRYDFFAELINDYAYEGVMVGHHYDDHIETYLIQKDRNMVSHTIGLATLSKVKGITVSRPLLKYTKEDLIEMCHDHDIPYSMDASNSDPKYTRNRIRLMDKDLDAIEKSLKQDLIDRELHLEKVCQAQASIHNNSLNRTLYLAWDKHLRMDVLRYELNERSSDTYQLSHRFFEELDRQIQVGKAFHEFQSINLYCEHDLIVFHKPKSFSYTIHDASYITTPDFKFSAKGDVKQALTLNDSDFPITVRNVQAGDRITMPYGTKKVHRYFIDQKIPRYLRDSWLVVENVSNECIYVMGMGCDVHHNSNNPSLYVIELNLL